MGHIRLKPVKFLVARWLSLNGELQKVREVLVIDGNEPFAQFGHLRALQDCFDAGSDTGQDINVCPRKPVTQLCIQIAGLKSKGKVSVTVNGIYSEFYGSRI